jgi:putative aldouronate transport system permease protein
MGMPAGARVKKGLKTFYKNKTLLLMCLPAIVFFIVFCYMPMPGIYLAFVQYNYVDGIFKSPFIGLKNFEFLFKSGQLFNLTKNTVLYNVAFIALGQLLQITVAILLNEIRFKRFKKVTQTIMFVPYFISHVLVGLFAYNILNYQSGVLNTILKFFGQAPYMAYSDPRIWPFIIVIAVLWQGTGYGSIVYFAALMGIDAEIFEAAQIDGANAWQRIWHINLASLRPTIVILVLFAIGGILKGNFGIIYNLVGAKNSTLWPTTDIIETFVFRALMNNFNFSMGSSVGLYQSLFGFLLVLRANFDVKNVEPDYALF